MATTPVTLLDSQVFQSLNGGALASTPFTIVNTVSATSVAYFMVSVASVTSVALTQTGWTPVGSQTLGADAGLGYTTAVWFKRLAVADRGTTIGVTIADATGQRMATQLFVFDGVDSVSDFAPTTLPANSLTSVATAPIAQIPDNTMVLGMMSTRFTSGALPTGTVNSPYVEDFDSVTTATTGNKIGLYSYRWAPTGGGTSGQTMPDATVTYTSAGRFAQWQTVLYPTVAAPAPVITPPTTTATNWTIWDTVTLDATAVGQGPVSYAWTQTGGNTVTITNPNTQLAKFKTPPSLTAQTLTFKLVVTDTTTSKTATLTGITYNVIAPNVRAVIGGIETPGEFEFPGTATSGGGGGTVTPPETVLSFAPMISAFVGGGGQSAIDISVFDENLIAVNTDTSGIRISRDGMRSNIIYVEGFSSLRERSGDAVKWSKVVRGRLFYTAGKDDSPTPPHEGGLWMIPNNADTKTPLPGFRIDGVVGPQISFNGGGIQPTQSPLTGGFQSGYPRHYGSTIAVDEFSIPGTIIIHAASMRSGAWRFKINASTMVVTEQVQYPGTSGFIRGVWLQQYKPNYTNDVYTKLIIAPYAFDTANPNTSGIKPLICNNANVANGASLQTATTITNAPFNIECMQWVNNPAGVPSTVIVAGTKTYMSMNLWNGGTPTFTDLNPAASGNPDNTRYWISVGATHNGTTNHIVVGSPNGKINNSTTPKGYDTEWHGTYNATLPTPAITWTTNSGKSSVQLNGDPGVDNTWWLANQNTPLMDPGAIISAYDTSYTNPSKVARACRGNSYLSKDYAYNWDPLRPAGSADHSSVSLSWKVGSTNLISTSGDWPIVAQSGGFVREPWRIVANSTRVSNGTAHDRLTGEGFWGGAGGGQTSHSMPTTDPTVEIYSVPESVMNNRTVFNDYTDAGITNNGWASGIAAGKGIRNLAVAYPAGGTAGGSRAIIASTMGTQGLWYKRTGGAWTQILNAAAGGAPFTATGATDSDSNYSDYTRGFFYSYDRNGNTVWRMSVSANGTISNATSIFSVTTLYSVAQDGVGFVDMNEADDTLWISNQNEVYYINNASTVGSSTNTSNAVVAGFGTNFPGEVCGPMVFKPKTGTVILATMGIKNNLWNYPLNGADGPRLMEITNPKTPSQWGRDKADDWTVSKLESYSYGWPAPSGMGRDGDGTTLYVIMQGTGVGIINTESVAIPAPTLQRLARTGSTLTVNGATKRLAGANAYHLVLNDNVRTAGVATIPSRSTIDATFAAIKGMKGNVLRVHTMGINYGNAEGNNAPTLMPSVGTYNETAFQQVDYIIAKANIDKVYLVVPFADRWNYYHGGAVTFAKMVLGGTNTDAFYLNAFFTNNTVITAFENYLTYWFNRVSTISGVAYKNDPAVAVAELGNEMYDAPLAWTSRVAAKIKALAPNVLVADPTAASGKYVTDSNVALTDPNVDILGGHFYPRDSTHLASDINAVAAANKVFMVGEFDWTASGATSQNGIAKPAGENVSNPDFLTQIRASATVGINTFWSILTSDAGVHVDGYQLYIPTQNSTQATGYAELQYHLTQMNG